MQDRTDQRRAEVVRASKMMPQVKTVIESKLRVEWSPEQIAGWLLDEQKLSISHEGLYRYIRAQKRAGGDFYTYLRRQAKKYHKRRNGESTRGHIESRASIDERPSVVDDKLRIGDWKIDTVIGKGHSGALVTFVERVTKFTVSAQVNSNSTADVTRATSNLLKPFNAAVHTMTAENGKEFSHHEKVSKALSEGVYFSHPYSSWEQGLNETTNGLLRQYFPKSTDFKLVGQAEVKRASKRLNARPRKDLSFKTPAQLMGEYMAKIAA